VVAEFAKTNDKLVIRGWCVWWKSSGRERREATGKHSFQGSVVGAVAGLDAIPISRTARVLAALAEQKGAGAAAAAPAEAVAA